LETKKPNLPRIYPSAARPSFFPKKTRRFPSPPHERVGFIGNILFVFEIGHNPIKIVDFVNMGNQIVKIILFSVNGSRMASILDRDLLISIRNVALKGKN